MGPCEWVATVEPIATAIGIVSGAFAAAWALRGIFGGV